MIIVLMGVSGSGKTLIGTLLAKRLNIPFLDADDYHPAANKEKMAAGVPLTDEDRRPWLEKLHELLCDWSSKGDSGILACSALKASYRGVLTNGIAESALRFVLLDAPRDLIAGRLAQRHHEFMNANLLDSQFATLEKPANALCVENDRDPEQVVDLIVQNVPMSPVGVNGNGK